ncbi:hypothetical protein BSLA_03r0181 [Burkholderia stabilis]|nr:hypothetical protein BSLA_03r0181 [Burkholderia stabilis]
MQSANDLLSSKDTWPGNEDWQTKTFHVHAADVEFGGESYA